MPTRRRILGNILLLTAPSAVHLMNWGLPALSNSGSLYDHIHLYLRLNGLLL